jgi:hypothetical protein
LYNKIQSCGLARIECKSHFVMLTDFVAAHAATKDRGDLCYRE